jgi:hypothetical protein
MEAQQMIVMGVLSIVAAFFNIESHGMGAFISRTISGLIGGYLLGAGLLMAGWV